MQQNHQQQEVSSLVKHWGRQVMRRAGDGDAACSRWCCGLTEALLTWHSPCSALSGWRHHESLECQGCLAASSANVMQQHVRPPPPPSGAQSTSQSCTGNTDAARLRGEEDTLPTWQAVLSAGVLQRVPNIVILGADGPSKIAIGEDHSLQAYGRMGSTGVVPHAAGPRSAQ
jgi:hypothetical protein